MGSGVAVGIDVAVGGTGVTVGALVTVGGSAGNGVSVGGTGVTVTVGPAAVGDAVGTAATWLGGFGASTAPTAPIMKSAQKMINVHLTTLAKQPFICTSFHLIIGLPRLLSRQCGCLVNGHVLTVLQENAQGLAVLLSYAYFPATIR